MDKIEHFRRQQQRASRLRGKPLLAIDEGSEAVQKLLSLPVDEARLTHLRSVQLFDSAEDNIDPTETVKLINTLKLTFETQRIHDLTEKTLQGVIMALAGPFGIGKFIAAYDKSGGNVTTIHNAKQKLYARTEDEYKRDDYAKTANREGKKFAGAGKKSVGSVYTQSQMDKNGKVTDKYTGKSEAATDTSPDHIASLSEFHQNGGFMISATSKADFATDTDNLALTKRSINQSMRDNDKKEWANKKQNGRDEENSKFFEVDPQKLSEQYANGQKVVQKHAPTTFQKAEYYVTNSVVTGIPVGFKMGIQQALGIVSVEFFAAVFAEIKCIFSDKEYVFNISDIVLRIKRILKSVINKWSDAIGAFKDGMLSSILSNIATTLINTVVTTAQRAVRMIREGFFSLLKAIRLILFPPNHLSPQQVRHEALKIFSLGGIIVVGVVLEEAIEKIFLNIPVFAAFSSLIVPAIIGAITGICSSLVCYLLDRMDLFGAVRNERDEFVLSKLSENIEERMLTCETLIQDILTFDSFELSLSSGG